MTTTELQLKPGTDGISQVRFSPKHEVLVTSWDAGVSLYSHDSGAELASAKGNAGNLCGAFNSQGDVAFVAGLDRVVNAWHFGTQRGLEALGTHEQPVRCMEFSVDKQLLVTGGWDSCMKLWDPRTPNAVVNTIRTSSKVFALDVCDKFIIGGFQDLHLRMFDWRKTENPLLEKPSSLGHQIRAIKISEQGGCLLSGSIEGRVAVENLEIGAPTLKRFIFKCHRGDNLIYPVNTIAVRPSNVSVFATGGGDGIVHIWSKDDKKRLASTPKAKTSVSSVEFSQDGELLAVAESYTFEKGDSEHAPDCVRIYKVNELTAAGAAST